MRAGYLLLKRADVFYRGLDHISQYPEHAERVGEILKPFGIDLRSSLGDLEAAGDQRRSGMGKLIRGEMPGAEELDALTAGADLDRTGTMSTLLGVLVQRAGKLAHALAAERYRKTPSMENERALVVAACRTPTRSTS